jgi:hypothetical protein
LTRAPAHTAATHPQWESLLISRPEFMQVNLLILCGIEIHIAEPLVLDPSPFEAEIVIAKLKDLNCQIVIKFQQNLFK